MKGKAKELFEEWYRDTTYHYQDECILLYDFNRLYKSMKWGVYQDFADSLGYDINVGQAHDEFIPILNMGSFGLWLKTRNEAREAAINKLEELINGI